MKAFKIKYITILTMLICLSCPSFANADQLKRRGSDDRHSDDRKPESSSPTSNNPNNPNSSSIAPGSNIKITIGHDSIGPKVKIERKQKIKRGNISEDKFETALKLPIPSQNLGINTAQDASSSDVILTLSRQNSNFAICSLDMNSIKRTRFGLRAEFKVEAELKLKNSALNLKLKKGACDLDLVTPGIQSGLPNLKSGDFYVVEVNDIALFSGNL